MSHKQSQLALAAERYGTPSYSFDIGTIQSQAERLQTLLPEFELYYSLKANASLGICNVLADAGIGADVASAGELETAVAANFPEKNIFVAGPFKTLESEARLAGLPESILSVDSPSEFRRLSSLQLTNRALLRLRPDFGSCAVVKAGSESRFGFTSCGLKEIRAELADSSLDVQGFHVFAGSQVLDAEKLNAHMTNSFELCLKAAEATQIRLQRINLGGGFGTTYGPRDEPLPLEQVTDHLNRIAARSTAQFMLELGRYFVAEAGYYLVSVLGEQIFNGRRAIVVDGGVHQRADMCGLCLRSNQYAPIVLHSDCDNDKLEPTDILGCLSLPDDVMLEDTRLPKLRRGDVLAFANAGAYGMWSSPSIFHGSPLPAETAFDQNEVYLMRARKGAASILADQRPIPITHKSTAKV